MLIIKSLKLKDNQVIFDLGAGDGIIIFEAAKEAVEKKLNTKFVAVEINPILIFILKLRCLFHLNKKNIKIIKGDMFKQRFWTSQNDNETMKQYSNITIYLYISPWYLEKTLLNIKSQLKKFKVVSYMYAIKSLKKKEKITRGKNSVFIYK